jgi:hypothetical protein
MSATNIYAIRRRTQRTPNVLRSEQQWKRPFRGRARFAVSFTGDPRYPLSTALNLR